MSDVPITAPGIYDIDIERYHHDPNLCGGPSISSSALKQLLPIGDNCPAKYWAYSPLNPNRFPHKPSKALDIGRAAHCLTLGEPEFAKHFIVSPYDDFRKKEAQQWRDAQTLTVLKAEDFEMVQTLSLVQKRSGQCMRAFEEGSPEKSLVWKDEETGIWLKARPDWLPHDPQSRLITEFKSAESIEPFKMSNAAFNYGYEMQAALQIDGVQAVMGVRPMGVCLICQEKEPPYLVEARLFTDEQIEDGRFLYRYALQTFAACIRMNNWPGYTEGPTYFETPYRHAMLMERLRNDTDRYSDKSQRNQLSPAEALYTG